MKMEDLEKANSPNPLEFPHFPARWQAVLGTEPEELRAAAAELGLNPEEPLQEKWCSHSYLSVLRGNWHLLSIAQLLELMNWPGERLIQVLDEEDFFWSKVRHLKPATGNVRYAELTEEQRRRTAEIRSLMEEYFPVGDSGYLDVPFAFTGRFGERNVFRKSNLYGFEFNFIHSFAASCGDVILNAEVADPVPENLLRQYVSMGVRGVWMHALLRHFYPVAGAGEYSRGREIRLENLKKIVARCKRYGLGVYLYPESVKFKSCNG